MSTQEAHQGEPGGAGPLEGDPSAPIGGEQPSEEELRAAYEAELSRITSADMVLQATVSLLNIGARRLGLVGGQDPAAAQASPERDLEQVRDAIDAVRGLMGVIERRAPGEARQLRDALAQLQMAFARESQAAAAAQDAPAGGQAAPAGAPQSSPPADRPPTGGQPPAGQPPAATPSGGPGPAESSGRLWVPGR